MNGKRIRNGILILLAAWFVCLAVSCVVPPLFHKKTEAEFTPVNLASCTEPGLSRERVYCIDDNREALLWRLRVIEAAEHDLIFSTFSLLEDDSGLDIMAALHSAAERGVHVKILVDGFNAAKDLNFSKPFQTLAAAENVEVRIYNPVNMLMPWKLNYRMHDKYVIADGSIYILGGRNTRNVSLGSYQEKHDQDRDMVVYCAEPQSDCSLYQVKAYFDRIWNCPDTKAFSSAASSTDPQMLIDRARNLQKLYPEAYMPADWEQATLPAGRITLLVNPIQAGNKAPELWEHLCSLMGEGEQIFVQSPYLIFNSRMYEDMESLSKGRDLKIITNSPYSGANICGCADYLNQSKKLRSMGAELYEYAGPHSTHTKTVLIDDRISIVGSFNFDIRSTYLDTEMMLVIDSPELNALLRQVNADYMERSFCSLPDGTGISGAFYEAPVPGFGKRALYLFLRGLIVPFRQLL